MEKQKKLWLILEPDYRFCCISDIFLATDLDQIFRVILVLPKPDLGSFKWENLQVGELWYYTRHTSFLDKPLEDGIQEKNPFKSYLHEDICFLRLKMGNKNSKA